MLRRTVLRSSPLVEVATVFCDAARAESAEPETAETFALVLVRRGCFRRRSNGHDALFDSTCAYFQRPGDEQVFTHPCDGGDVCTMITLSSEIAPDEVRAPRVPIGRIPTPAAFDASHRQLVDACASGIDESELLDATLRLTEGLLHRPAAHATRLPRVGPGYERQRRVADAAREILNQAPATTLAAIATDLAISPRHLSRVFHAHSGMTFARYRNELRCRVVLEAVADDAPLVRVAAELGFSDQAHLTRTVRRLTGRPPSAHRRPTSPRG